MRVSFVLPFPAGWPMGGYIMVYAYADFLASRGHDVTVVHPLSLDGMDYDQPYAVRRDAQMRRRDWMAPWFAFKANPTRVMSPRVDARHMPDADAVIATAWQTAVAVNLLAQEKGVKFYFVQGLETWAGPSERVLQTYRLGLTNIVVSRWLEEELTHLGAPVAAVVPNGIDIDFFSQSSPGLLRNPQRVAWVYTGGPFKGGMCAIEALSKARLLHPELDAVVWGTGARPSCLPDWIQYHENPPRTAIRDMLHSSGTFLSSSRSEGFGLPGLEAMAAGCAVVTTNSGGVRDYAHHRQTALVVPPDDPDALSSALVQMLSDRTLRDELAQHGLVEAARFNLADTAELFEQALLTGVGHKDHAA